MDIQLHNILSTTVSDLEKTYYMHHIKLLRNQTATCSCINNVRNLISGNLYSQRGSLSCMSLCQRGKF